MMKRYYLKIGFIALMITLFSGFLFSSTTLSAEKVIKIGHVAGLTGPISAQADFFKAREDMFEIINEAGGIRGYKIKTYWADTRYQLPAEISAYKRFVSQGIVGFLPCSTGATEQLKLIGKTYGVPVVFAVNSMVNRYPPGWAFPIFPTYGDCTAGTMEWILKNMWKKSSPPKVAVIVTDTGYGRAVEEALPYFKSKGIECVFKAYISRGLIDLTPQLLQAEKAGADFIISNPLGEVKVLPRDFKRLGLNKKGMYIITPWLAWIASNKATKDASGFTLGTWQCVIPDFEDQHGLPELKQLKNHQIKKYGEIQPSGMYWAMFGETMALTEAVGKAIDRVGLTKLTGREVYKELERVEVDAEKTLGNLPALKNTPGKRGMSDKAIISIAKEGKWEALTGWVPMPNLQEWKKAHPEYYEK